MEQRLLKMRRDSIPFAQWSLGVLGADSVLPFALTNSGHFRLCRTAHRADASLVCRGLLVPNQRFCRFFRFFPLPSGNCLVFPVFSGFCRLFPCFSAYFQTGLNRTLKLFLRFYRFNRPLQPSGLQHEDIKTSASESIHQNGGQSALYELHPVPVVQYR